MKITFNPIPFIGALMAWHWYGWHLFVVCMLLTSGLTFAWNDFNWLPRFPRWGWRMWAEKRDVSVARPGDSIGQRLK
jgi:hypothetical protein